jgi:hypothetical protein
MKMDDDSDFIEFTWKGSTYRCPVEMAEEIERRIDEMQERAYEEENGLEDPLEAESTRWPPLDYATNDPFCGCDTCVRRETVAITMALTIEGVAQGVVEKIKVVDLTSPNGHPNI